MVVGSATRMRIEEALEFTPELEETCVGFAIEPVGGPADHERLVIDGDPMDPRDTIEMWQEISARALDPKTSLPPHPNTAPPSDVDRTGDSIPVIGFRSQSMAE